MIASFGQSAVVLRTGKCESRADRSFADRAMSVTAEYLARDAMLRCTSSEYRQCLLQLNCA